MMLIAIQAVVVIRFVVVIARGKKRMRGAAALLIYPTLTVKE